MTSNKDWDDKLIEDFRDISTRTLKTINDYDQLLSRLKDKLGPENEQVLKIENRIKLAKQFAVEAARAELSLTEQAREHNPEAIGPLLN